MVSNIGRNVAPDPWKDFGVSGSKAQDAAFAVDGLGVSFQRLGSAAGRKIQWGAINGVSFLPYDGGKYKLAPYEEIDHRTYERLIKKVPRIDYKQLSKYELEDNTQGKAEYACNGDKCDI